MILLLGGASETATLAQALAESGFSVLVSTATDESLDVGAHERIIRRCGPLGLEELEALARSRDIAAIVDSTHPYATAAHENAWAAAESLGLPYFRYSRPATAFDGSCHMAKNHEEAAAIACSFGRPALLTTGAGNLAPYAEAFRKAGVRLVVRALPRDESIAACKAAGISLDDVITGRGPFSVDENRRVITRFGIGVLVTKDGGKAGGAPEKIEAARLESCEVVVVGRPDESARPSFSDIDELVHAIVADPDLASSRLTPPSTQG